MTVKDLSRRLLGAAAAVALLGVCTPGSAQQAAAADSDIEVVPIRDGIYLLGSDGSANVTLQIGEDGLLLVDSMNAQMGEKLLAAVRKLSDKPIRYLLNTNGNSDNTGGNPVIAAAGSTIAGGNIAGAIDDSKEGAAVIAHENVLTHMSAQDPPPPFEGWPTSTYFTERKDVFFNGQGIQLQHQPNASTDGDSIVIFQRSAVISAGQLFAMESYPFIDVKNGGSLQGIIDALNHIIDLTIPIARQEGGTVVVPAYGRVCDESEVVEYRDMLTLIRNNIRELIKEGRSLQQVLAVQPTLGYDVRYGSDSGPWTTKMFVETVYRELKSGKSKSR